MQLENRKSLRNALSAITATLLGVGSVGASGETKLESSMLLYSEPNRVSVLESVVKLQREIKEDQKLSVKLTFDALTGASPSGAAPSKQIQTFTRPSGKGSYTVSGGEIPLDDSFRDSRFTFSGTYSRPAGRLSDVSLGLYVSTEYDYFSIGVNGGITRDFNDRNSTIGLSGSMAQDRIKPEGGIPIPFAPMGYPGGSQPRGDDSKSKTVYDFMVGLTQVITRSTIAQLNYSHSYLSGYLTDPFKILSLVQDVGSADPGEPVSYLYENRPDTRTKQSVFGRIRKSLSSNTIDLSYRYFWDDWDVASHTLETRFRLQLRDGKYIQPQIRWYSQSPASFYRHSLVQGEPSPSYASADFRLGDFDALTVGAQFGFSLTQGQGIKLTIEYYSQFDGRSPPDAIGSLKNYDLYPNVKAIMFRVGYSRSY